MYSHIMYKILAVNNSSPYEIARGQFMRSWYDYDEGPLSSDQTLQLLKQAVKSADFQFFLNEMSPQTMSISKEVEMELLKKLGWFPENNAGFIGLYRTFYSCK